MSEEEKANTGKSPSQFLQGILDKQVIVKLHSGAEFRGKLVALDGYMNVALVETEEYFGGHLKGKYGDAFLRGNNVLFVTPA